MKRTLFARIAVVATIALAGCDNPFETQSDLVRIRRAPQALDITNLSSEPVYYFASERGALALLDWLACADPVTCKSVAPGATKRIPYVELASYSEGAREAVVFHWRLVPLSVRPAYAPDSIRATIVKLR